MYFIFINNFRSLFLFCQIVRFIFEKSLIITDDGDICTYCFCYVNKDNGTAFIEPVCTREKYRGKGFCKQMLYGVINRLKEMNIENAYINSYDWRKKVYNSSGFETEDSIGFWHKKIK